MNKTGKVLRVPGSMPGLVSLDGQQHPFTLEDHWRSDDPPLTGMAVDAVITAEGRLESLMRRELGKEASAVTAQAWGWVSTDGFSMAQGAVRVIGWPVLLAVGALFLIWQSMDFISIRAMGQQQGLTLEQFLPVLKGRSFSDFMVAGASGAGLSGWFMWFSLAAPLSAPWIRHRHAALLGLAPLVFAAYVFIGFKVLMSRVAEAAVGVSGFAGGEFARQMVKEINDAVSLGTGAHATLVASGALAVMAVRNWIQAGRGPS